MEKIAVNRNEKMTHFSGFFAEKIAHFLGLFFGLQLYKKNPPFFCTIFDTVQLRNTLRGGGHSEEKAFGGFCTCSRLFFLHISIYILHIECCMLIMQI